MSETVNGMSFEREVDAWAGRTFEAYEDAKKNLVITEEVIKEGENAGGIMFSAVLADGKTYAKGYEAGSELSDKLRTQIRMGFWQKQVAIVAGECPVQKVDLQEVDCS